MKQVGGVSSNYHCDEVNICTSGSNNDTYEVSRRSLPLYTRHKDRHRYLDKAIIVYEPDINVTTATNSSDTFSKLPESTDSHLDLLRKSSGEMDKAQVKLVKQILPSDQCSRGCDVMNNIKMADTNCESLSSTDKEEEHYGSVLKSLDKSIKIKLSLDSDILKQTGTTEKCTFKIDLSANKVSNNKDTQQYAISNYVDGVEITNRNQMLNVKQLKLVNTYTSVVKNECVKSKETEVSGNAPKAEEDRKFLLKHTDSSSSFQQISSEARDETGTGNNSPYVNLAGTTAVSKARDYIDQDYETSSEYMMKDESVQATTNQTVGEDHAMLKLGMMLDILNNSEYNSYNKDNLGIALSNEKSKDDTSKLNLLENNFRLFIEEMKRNESQLKIDGNKFRKCEKIGKVLKKNYVQNAYIKPISLNSDEKKINHRILKKNIIKMNVSSLESIELQQILGESINAGNNRTCRRPKNRQHIEKHMVKTNLTNDNSLFRKLMQNILTRFVPSTTGTTVNKESRKSKKKKHGVHTLYTVTDNSRTSKGLWTKMNPFRFCLTREKTLDTIPSKDSRQPKKQRKFMKTTINTVQYCSLPSNDFNECQLEDAFATTMKNELYKGFPLMFTNRFATKFSTLNPYNSFRFVQCPTVEFGTNKLINS